MSRYLQQQRQFQTIKNPKIFLICTPFDQIFQDIIYSLIIQNLKKSKKYKYNNPPNTIIKPMQIKPYLHNLLLLLITTLLHKTQSILTITPMTISALANYTIQFTEILTTIAAGSIVQLELPFNYYSAEDLYAHRPYLQGTDPSDFCPIDCTGVAIQYAGFVFNITGLFTVDMPLQFKFTIVGVPNPRAAFTIPSFTIRVIDAVGNTQFPQTTNSFTFLPNTMTCTATATEYPIVRFHSTVSFTINPITNPRDYPMSIISLTLPKNWLYEPFISDSLTTSIYCLSTTQSYIICQPPNTQGNQTTVLVSGATYNSSISFQMHSIVNPSSAMIANSISISTMYTTSTGSRIKLDSCTVGIAGFTQNSFLKSQVTIGYDSNTMMSVNISGQFPSKVAAGTKVLFIISPTLPLTGSTCLAYKSSSLLNITVNIFPNNTVVIDPFTSLQPPVKIQIRCTSITRPRTAFTLANITISSTYNGSNVASLSCCSTLLKGRNSLNVSIATDKPYLQTVNAMYTIQIVTSVMLIVGDMAYIYFPKQYSIPTGSITCTASSPSSSISATPTCTGFIGNKIKITSFLTASAPVSTQITFSISGIQNPASNPSTTPFQIYLLSSLTQIIESNLTSYVAISAAIINTFTVTTPNTQVLATPVQYGVQFTSNGLLLLNYAIIVILPVEIGIDLSTLACTVNGVTAPCWYDSVANSVQVRIINSLASTSVNLQINGGINPESLAPTQSFSLEILDPNTNIIQVSNSSLSASITMVTTKPFKNLFMALLPSNSVTNPTPNIFEALNTLQVIAITQTKIKSTHKLLLTYNPQQILFNYSSFTSLCSTGYTCVNDTVNGLINIGGLAVGSDTIIFNITQTIGLLMRPTIKLTLLSTTNNKILETTQSLSQYMPDLITYNVTQTSYEYSATTDITIDYSFTSLTATGLAIATSRLAYILVYVPSQYVTSYTNNVYNTSVINGRVTLTGLTNPAYTDVVSGYFYVSGLGAGAQLLSISAVNWYYQHVCTLPCRTCTSNLTNCQSCYSWNPRNFLHTNTTTNTSTCRSTCPRFYYQNTTTSTCQPCNSNCYECDSTVSTKCLSCVSGKYLHQIDYVCYNDCPAGFYQYGTGNDGVCRACPSNCLTCFNQTYCYTCAAGLYLYGNRCLTGCPFSTYSSTSPIFSCTDCATSKPNCLDCDQTQCFACTQSYYLSQNQCYSSCPFPLYPTISGLCRACQCANCSNYANNCTVCKISAPFMYNNSCYTSCPSGLYSNTLKICLSCPTNCITCSNSNVCTLCKQGFVIMTYSISNVSCIANISCPNTTILTLSPSGIPSCLGCTPNCATCSISVTFCLTCLPSYNLFGNQCMISCPSPYHPILSICQKCISTCQACNLLDPYNCTQCKPGYYLYNNTCYTACPSGTYMDLLSKQCVQCLNVCLTCSNATNCTTCVTGYFLFNWFCYNSCPTIPVFYYQYNGVCSACQPQCQACLGSPVACTACSSSSYLYNVVTKQCTFQCTPPYYQNESTCIGCQSPCVTCDTTYNSCSSCAAGLYIYNGTCVSTCPSGYYKNTSSFHCQKCIYPCKICVQNQCLLCQSFAYMYQKSCVLVCPAQMPYQQPGYCSDCIGIGFCAKCTKQTGTDKDICSKCVYPYVLFEGSCLNQCPTNYTANDAGDSRTCQKTAQYIAYLNMKQQYNRPILPPFLMFGLYLIVGIIISVVSHNKYRFTYHAGFMLSLLVFVNSIFTYYSLYFVYSRYEGQYVPVVPQLPYYLIIASIVFNSVILTIVFWLLVLKNIYLKDVRYLEWKQRNNKYWWLSTILLLLFGGHRLHKINYSKIFGLDRFSYRIVSVQKFYEEDIITYCSAIGDLCEIVAGVICVYNVFMTYNGVFFIGYESFLFKLVLWVLILYDLKKPDRGFFIGDEQEAEEQMKKQEEEQMKKLNRVDTETFAKLVRTKSAYVLTNKKYFGNLDVDDFISVYNPDDYEEVIKVPNKKIQKNIYKGKYRKGRKITIQEKLNKFVDTIKPRPPIDKKKVPAYIRKLIYWKPPQFKKVTPIKQLPSSQHSLLALLEKKQMEYKEDLDNIQLVDDEKQKKYYTRPRYDQRTFLDDIDETIPNETVEMFYPNFENSQRKNSIDVDDLLNLNYARRKHLDRQEQQEKLELESKSKRKLHHEPQKKRKNLKGFGQMVLKNQYQY